MWFFSFRLLHDYKTAMKAVIEYRCSGWIVGRTRRTKKWNIFLSCLICLTLNLCSLNELAAHQTGPDVIYDVNVASLNAADALNSLARQTGVTLLFPYDLARSRQANAVNGRYTLQQALDLMLQGTGLSGGLSDKGILTISRAKPEERKPGGKTMQQNNNRPSKWTSFIAGIATWFTGTVGIQNATAQTGEAATGQRVLEEVVVTAQKRAQNMQDIGIAVSAFTGDQIKELKLSQPIDLAAQTPGLDIKNAFGKTNPIFTIRGVGLNDYHSNNNPSAAVHIDEVYLGSSAFLSFQMFDIERVEVLKGPQGTLYGRNSTAGAINFIPVRPSQEFEAHIDVSYGNYNTFDIEAAVGGAITDIVSGRIAIQTTQSDGFVTNQGTVGYDGMLLHPNVPAMTATTSNDEAGDVDAIAWRASLLFEPSEEVDFQVSVHGSREDSGGNYYGQNGVGGDGFVFPSTFFEDTDGDPFTVYEDAETFIDSEAYGGSIKINWELDFATLTSISAYEEIDRHILDGDGLPLHFFVQDYKDDLWQFTQEIRLTSNNAGKWNWIIGAFYSEDEIDFSKSLDSPALFFSNLTTAYTQKGDSWAIFGNTEWQITDQFKILGGLRYTEETKTYNGGTIDHNPWNASCTVQGFGNCLSGFDTTITVGVNGPLTFVDTAEKYDTTDLSGKIGLNWTPKDNLLLYASISKGFKSGGFDGSTVFSASDVTPFNEEILWAYEIGMKTTLLNETLRLNASAFYYDFKDMQAEALVPLGGGISSSIRTNAGDVEIMGMEYDIYWRPIAGLDLKVGIAALDSEIKKWKSIDPVERAFFEGLKAPDAPELTFNGLVRYEWSLTNGMVMAAMTDFNYSDGSFKEIENIETLKIDDYWVWNARLSLSSADNAWTVALWAKNLADEKYVTNTVEDYDNGNSRFEWYGAPRTYGVSVNYSWH